MRICSLLPSGTEILYTLGLGDDIVAVTHECDYPPEASAKPHITESIIDHDRLSSLEIDHHVAKNIGRHGSIYRLKEDMLEELQPDLIVTQELCEVCAVSYSDVQHASRVLDGPNQIVSLEPKTIGEMLDTILMVGEIAGRKELAERRVAELRERLDAVREKIRGVVPPRVYSMEWLDPAYSAGHWVPQMVENAGGHEILGLHGEKSARITPEQVMAAQPEVIVLMPCGFSLERTIEEYHRTPMFDGWKDLPAVRSGEVYAVNGSAYFNRSGPRLVDGVEILASLLHPGRGPVPGRIREDQVMARMDLLKGFLEENPNDSFSRYALSLEYVKLGQFDDARREFETVREKDPDYLATYYQLGQLYIKMGLPHEAEKTLRAGIGVAVKQKDEHTQSELEGALESIL